MILECTGVAIRDAASGSWIALCPEYDLATEAAFPQDALHRLGAIVQETVAVAQEHKLAVGHPVTEEKLAEFVASHSGEARAPMRCRIGVDTDNGAVYVVIE